MDEDELKQEIKKYKTAFEEALQTAQFAADHGDFTYFQIGKDSYFGVSQFRKFFKEVYSYDTLVRLDMQEARMCSDGDEFRFPKIEDYFNLNEQDFPDANQENEPFYAKPKNIKMLFIILSNSYKYQIHKHNPNDPLSVLVQQLFPIYQNQELSPKEKFDEIQKVKTRFCGEGNKDDPISAGKKKSTTDAHKKLEPPGEKSEKVDPIQKNHFFRQANSWDEVSFLLSADGITIKAGKSKHTFTVKDMNELFQEKKAREFLYALFKVGGIFFKDNFKDPHKKHLKNYVSDLRKTLRKIFNIIDDPLIPTGDGGYKTAFSITTKTPNH
jgi:hypothetical protein